MKISRNNKMKHFPILSGSPTKLEGQCTGVDLGFFERGGGAKLDRDIGN